jgi:hypothetical protein
VLWDVNAEDGQSLRDAWNELVIYEGGVDQAYRRWLSDASTLCRFTDVLAPWTDWEREAFARLMLKEPPPWRAVNREQAHE